MSFLSALVYIILRHLIMIDEEELMRTLMGSKNKIWEDKKRLGLTAETQPKQLLPSLQDQQDGEKEEFISTMICAQGQGGKQGESMVRFGEYSPHNPGLLSPGKTLLGLGEYEEKRRQILERKKREYLEQMAQVRQNVKDLKYQQDSKVPTCDVGTQTDLQLTGYIDVEKNLSPTSHAPATRGEHPYSVSTQTSGGNVRWPVATITPVSQSASYLAVSPRERKMAEFRESYSPSFLQGAPAYQTGFDANAEVDTRKRREAYQEELRKQIEEKRRLEEEEREREREKEAAIARRAELQREKMRQEYLQEEALKRERQLLRMQQTEDFLRKQEQLKLEAELERESEARRKLEKRLEELEAGLAQHAYTTQALGASLPVPALRSKLAKASLPTPMELNPHEVKQHDSRVEHKQRSKYSPREELSSHEEKQHDSRVEHKQRSKYSPRFNESGYSFRGSHSDYSLNRYSPVRDASVPVTLSYHRPPTEVMQAAGYQCNPPSLHDENRNNLLETSTKRSQEVPEDLDNRLSIPVLRAPSPVIPTARIQASTGSDKMHRLEGKWQVPAVEKSLITGDTDSVLTQLGAVRHQLQLEQMRFEQQLEQRFKHKS